MISLYTEIEFEEAKSTDLLPCKCIICNNTFYKQKRVIKRTTNNYDGNNGNFCSRQCVRKSQGGSKLIKCANCGKEHKSKNSEIKKSKSGNNFCSKSCAAVYNNKGRIDSEITKKKKSDAMYKYYSTHVVNRKQINRIKVIKTKKEIIKKSKKIPLIIWNCPVCNKELKLRPCDIKKRKYCSGKCRNIINNQSLSGSTSIAEKMLQEALTINFPNLKIMYNDRKILNGLELDVYIPELNMGIEWNGIYHYRKVREDNSLERTIIKDKYKIKKCFELKIKLIVIKDLTSNKKFIREEIKKIIKYVCRLMAKITASNPVDEVSITSRRAIIN